MLKNVSRRLRRLLVITAAVPGIFSPAVSGRVVTERHYEDTPFVVLDSCRQTVLAEGTDDFVFDVRAAMDGIGERPGAAPNYWGIAVVFPSDTLRLTLRHGNSAFGDILDHRENILTVTRGTDELWRGDVGAFEGASGGYNTLRLHFNNRNRTLELSGGGKKMTDIFSGKLDSDGGEPQSVSVWSKGPLTVASYSLESSQSPRRSLATGRDEKSLKEYFLSTNDPAEGFWQYLDRENDPDYARLGGRYLLAVVKSDKPEGGYDIIYVGGAEICASEWEPMMLKGRLRPTIFQDHYDLEWIDSTFETMSLDQHAQLTDGAILSLSFPLLKTTLRFSKMKLRP